MRNKKIIKEIYSEVLSKNIQITKPWNKEMYDHNEGVSELMKDKVTGFLVKKGDSDDISEKIALLLNDKQRAMEMGEAGRKFIEDNFNLKVITTKFVSELGKIDLLK